MRSARIEKASHAYQDGKIILLMVRHLHIVVNNMPEENFVPDLILFCYFIQGIELSIRGMDLDPS